MCCFMCTLVHDMFVQINPVRMLECPATQDTSTLRNDLTEEIEDSRLLTTFHAVLGGVLAVALATGLLLLLTAQLSQGTPTHRLLSEKLQGLAVTHHGKGADPINALSILFLMPMLLLVFLVVWPVHPADNACVSINVSLHVLQFRFMRNTLRGGVCHTLVQVLCSSFTLWHLNATSV